MIIFLISSAYHCQFSTKAPVFFLGFYSSSKVILVEPQVSRQVVGIGAAVRSSDALLSSPQTGGRRHADALLT